MRTSTLAAVLGALLLGATACGTDAGVDTGGPAVSATNPDTPGPAAGMCAPGVTDCVDVVVESEGEFDVETERETAQAMLGLAEDELAPDVRIGRRGDEQLALTEDYVLGRKTVELDDDGGVFRVTSVVVELPDGPETFGA